MISPEDVKYVAGLSRIHLKDEEIPAFTQNMENILGYIEKLNELNVDGVKPTSHVLNVENVFRDDAVETPFTQEEALGIAKHKHNGFFQVPKVIE